MTINSTYFKERKLLLISMGMNFDFSEYREFREIYEALPVDATGIELDMKMTNHIDSSALGMILLMNESVQNQVGRIDIINTSPEIRKIFDLTQFSAIFNIPEN